MALLQANPMMDELRRFGEQVVPLFGTRGNGVADQAAPLIAVS
jgi:hypothetical protein